MTWKRHEVKYIAIYRRPRGHLQHSITNKALFVPCAKNGYRCLGRARSVTPAQECSIFFWQARHSGSNVLEELVKGFIEFLDHIHFYIASETAKQRLINYP